MRALPEKTLEHWLSREVARRFPSASLWWPSSGEDIMVDDIGGRPGKWFMLEVKTTDWNTRSNYNRLTIDLEQLDLYLRTGMPVFYVFPVPPWSGALTSALPWLRQLRRGDLGNPMAGLQWFAHWTYVLSAGDVASGLRTSWPSSKSETLFTSPQASHRKPIPTGTTLDAFLHLQAQCGDERSQAALVVPTTPSLASRTSRTDLSARLHELVQSDRREDQPLTQFLPVPGDDNGDLYRELELEDLAQSLLELGRRSAGIVAVSIDAHDLALG